MSKRVLLLLLILLMTGAAIGQGCPANPPPPHGNIHSWTCGGRFHCPLGSPITFRLLGYNVQPCDEVTWDFGDGSAPVAVTGSTEAAHVYQAVGNYTLTATVRNSLGSRTFQDGIAVGYGTRIEIGFFAVLETQTSVTVPVRRTGDPRGRVSVTVEVVPRNESGQRPIEAGGMFEVVFEEGGETVKELTFAMRAPDDGLWDGHRTISLVPRNPSGGVLVDAAHLSVIDDEPQPRLEADDLVVREGTGGVTRVTIPFRLTAPLLHDFRFAAELFEETATWPSDFQYRWEQRAIIPAGQTTGALEIEIVGDREPEPDEWFPLVIYADWDYRTDPGLPPDVSGGWMTITILNDDAALTPRFASALVGERLVLTLDLGLQAAEEVTVPIRNIRPDVLEVQESLTVPAGERSVAFDATVIGEGEGLIELDVAGHALSSRIVARQPRALQASESSLALPPGGTRTFTLSLAPAHDAPVTVTLAADEAVVEVPATVTIPAGGSATVEVRGVGRGEAVIAVTAADADIRGAAVEVNVLTMRRRAAR